MSLFSNFLGVKTENAAVALNRVVAGLDPQTMGQAGIRTIEDALRDSNRSLSELQQVVEAGREKVASDEREVKQRMGAAEILLGKGMEEKAGKLLGEVDDWNHRLESDKAGLKGAEASLTNMASRVSELEDKLRQARQVTQQAERDIQDAKLDKQRALEAEAQARRDAGLTTKVNDLDAAMSAMKDAAQKTRLDADAARRNAASISAVAGHSDDADVKAAMAEAAGTAKPSQTVAERLAALKSQMGQAA